MLNQLSTPSGKTGYVLSDKRIVIKNYTVSITAKTKMSYVGRCNVVDKKRPIEA